jgi:nifR3 family TIM-barrel protein
MNFWQKLPKPIFVLAPMANVTDAAFRRIIAKYSKWGGADIGDGSKESLPAEALRVGGPDVMWTEFVSCEGLCSRGKEKLLPDLWYTEAERPIVAQVFGTKPEHFLEVGRLIADLGFDGLDINMGCPDRAVVKQGSGAALIKNPALAKELILAAKEGIKQSGRDIPVSVKTRIGDTKNDLREWLPILLETELAVITVHARTRKELSLVPARWETVKEAVEIRNSLKSETLIFGNGDVKDLADARQKIKESGADGVMIGRGIFGNPWLFSNRKLEEISLEERFSVLLEHTRLFEELFTDIKPFEVMKKHYKAYLHGFDGAKELRMKCMEAENTDGVEKVINEWKSGGFKPKKSSLKRFLSIFDK